VKVKGITSYIQWKLKLKACLILEKTVKEEKNYQDEAYVTLRLRFSLQQLHGRHHNIVGRYEIFIPQMAMDLFPVSWIFLRLNKYM
jgi:hypothetical protein